MNRHSMFGAQNMSDFQFLMFYKPELIFEYIFKLNNEFLA